MFDIYKVGTDKKTAVVELDIPTLMMLLATYAASTDGSVERAMKTLGYENSSVDIVMDAHKHDNYMQIKTEVVVLYNNYLGVVYNEKHAGAPINSYKEEVEIEW